MVLGALFILILAACSQMGDVTPPPSLGDYQPGGQAAGQWEELPVSASISPEAEMSLATEEVRSDKSSQGEAKADKAAGARTIVIRGQAANDSTSGSIPENLVISLHGFNNQVEVINRITKTDEYGRFIFSDVYAEPGLLFFVTTKYMNVIYRSTMAHFDEGLSLMDLSLTIYETTEDASAIQVESLHLLFDFPPDGTVQIVEMWVLSNLSDRTVVASMDNPVVDVMLPDGAIGLSFEEGVLGDRFYLTESGFADTAPLQPGREVSELVFSFFLPYRRGLDLIQRMQYPVNTVIVLIPDSGPEVQGAGIEDQGVMRVSSIAFRHYRLDAINRDANLEITLSGSAPGESGGILASSPLEVVIGVLAMISALGLAAKWVFLRDRFYSPKEEEEGTAVKEDLNLDLEAVIQQMADLDSAYDAGQVSGAMYIKRRIALKQQAVCLMQ
jgi:hypothetical protein